MIPTINRVVHCKWPQIERRLLGPMKDRVQHHSTRPRGDGRDGSFGRTVLVVRSDAGKNLLFDLYCRGHSGTRQR
jgi:hypothetical protein